MLRCVNPSMSKCRRSSRVINRCDDRLGLRKQRKLGLWGSFGTMIFARLGWNHHHVIDRLWSGHIVDGHVDDISLSYIFALLLILSGAENWTNAQFLIGKVGVQEGVQLLVGFWWLLNRVEVLLRSKRRVALTVFFDLVCICQQLIHSARLFLDDIHRFHVFVWPRGWLLVEQTGDQTLLGWRVWECPQRAVQHYVLHVSRVALLRLLGLVNDQLAVILQRLHLKTREFFVLEVIPFDNRVTACFVLWSWELDRVILFIYLLDWWLVEISVNSFSLNHWLILPYFCLHLNNLNLLVNFNWNILIRLCRAWFENDLLFWWSIIL